MAKQTVEKLIFIGRPFPHTLMDEHRTFTQSNLQMENDEVFKKFLQDNDLEDTRSSMIVFGPENFMYWYGVVVEKELKVPNGLMKYVLPKAEIDLETEKGNLTNFNLPQNYIVPTFFKKLEDEGIKVYENPGDSETPYLVQTLSLSKNELKQFWYLMAK